MVFKKVLLKDIAEVIMGSSPRSEFYSESEGVPFLQGTRTFGRIYPKIDTYTKKVTRMAKKNDILFSVRAPVGNINFAPTDLCIGRGLSCIKPISVDKKFLYYLLIGNIRMYESKSTGTIFSSINKKELESLEFEIPNIKLQKEIGSFLWFLDSKIELNNSIISNLEELAQTLFKRWFVDFEFPNEEGKPYKSSGGKMVESELGMIPEGWVVKTLDYLLEFKKDSVKKGKQNDHKKYVPIDLLPMKQMTFTNYYPGTEAKSSLIAFKENDILLGAMRVYFHRVCLAPYDGITRTTCFVLRSRENIYRYYALLKVFQDETINYANSTSKGTTIPYATWENGLSKLNVVVPTYDVLDRFNEIASPIFLKLKSLSNQSQNLKKLRDTLLPKLLSGEIELSDEEEVKELV